MGSLRSPLFELEVAMATPPRRSLRVSEEGWVERRCSRCGEWWPATTEFFGHQPGRSIPLHNACKACIAEWRAERRRTDPAFRERDRQAALRWLAQKRLEKQATGAK